MWAWPKTDNVIACKSMVTIWLLQFILVYVISVAVTGYITLINKKITYDFVTFPYICKFLNL